MKDELEKLGFAGHQAEIYLALVDLKQCGAGDLVRKTGIHRNIVYETLDRLIAKRLVLKVLQKKVFQYRITDPEKIIENQRINLSLAESIIPDIKSRSENQNDIMVWDGIEGFRNFRLLSLESIKQGSVIHILGAIPGSRWAELMGTHYKRSEKIRLKKKIIYKMVIYRKDDFDTAMVKGRRYYDVRIVENNFVIPGNVMIWDDNIAIHTYEEPYSVIQIKSKPLVKTFMNYFNIMWGIGKEID